MRVQRAAIILAIGVVLFFIASPLGFVRTAGHAQTQGADCDAGETIGAVIDRLRSGDTLLVRGTCREAVVIPAASSGITLDGQGEATILSADTAVAVILVFGRNITIKGFSIVGGRNGINVLRGASVIIDGNTIQDTGAGGQPGSGLGVNVGQHSFASFVNNTIRNNRVGILVHENSSARIGFIDVAVAGTPNVIRDNSADGIAVQTSSNARILGSIIADNGGSGVRVYRSSHAEIAANTISGNRGHGIDVSGSSGVDMEVGAGTFNVPNTTDTGAENGGFGVVCSVGGHVQGDLGTLSGLAGTRLDATCIDALRR